jgi:hypothetical protein
MATFVDPGLDLGVMLGLELAAGLKPAATLAGRDAELLAQAPDVGAVGIGHGRDSGSSASWMRARFSIR